MTLRLRQASNNSASFKMIYLRLSSVKEKPKYALLPQTEIPHLCLCQLLFVLRPEPVQLSGLSRCHRMDRVRFHLVDTLLVWARVLVVQGRQLYGSSRGWHSWN